MISRVFSVMPINDKMTHIENMRSVFVAFAACATNTASAIAIKKRAIKGIVLKMGLTSK
tara:strand:- start:88 stop:264 length:177 start_codon:yes stop_codon:yes gene_type:complete